MIARDAMARESEIDFALLAQDIIKAARDAEWRSFKCNDSNEKVMACLRANDRILRELSTAAGQKIKDVFDSQFEERISEIGWRINPEGMGR